MMKCISVTASTSASSERKVVRVTDEEAQRLVRQGVAQFVPKSEWKSAMRKSEEKKGKVQ